MYILLRVKIMFVEQRREKILNLLSENYIVTVAELADKFGVSLATIRTDLNRLDQEGKITRTHGGAVLKQEKVSRNVDHSYQIRATLNIEEKHQIAENAIKYLKDGQCIFFDASSTCYELAKVLFESSLRITCITNGLEAAILLKENPRITVLIVGGMVRGSSNAVEGLMGIDMLKNFNIDIFFLGSSGISLINGITDFNIYEMELKQRVIEMTDKVIALMDYTKFDTSSNIRLVNLEDVDLIITNKALPQAAAKKYQKVCNLIMV